MKFHGYKFNTPVVVALMLTTVLGWAVGDAWATTPLVNGAHINVRVFNDCPTSTVVPPADGPAATYPAAICITDNAPGCAGFANLHNWSFSIDGGVTPADFSNGDEFVFSADMVISGTGQGEAGLRISPWYSLDVDGLFNVRTTDGEIAVFGGRLPFFSFTGTFGVRYVKGDLIHLEMNYSPNGLSMASPATIEYKLTYRSIFYTSGPLAFDEGNITEDPPHGLWGILSPSWVGGSMKIFLSEPGDDLSVCWTDIVFGSVKPTAITSSWGRLKTLYR